MYFGCPLLRALNKTGKLSFFQGRQKWEKFSFRPCTESYHCCWWSSVVWCLSLLPGRGQSLPSYSPVWVLVPPTCHGPGAFVDLRRMWAQALPAMKNSAALHKGWPREERGFSPQALLRFCKVGFELYFSPLYSPSTWQCNSPLCAVPYQGAGFFQCHLPPLRRHHSTSTLLHFYNWERVCSNINKNN